MSWTTVAEVKAQVQRLWERGELLRNLLNGEASFPVRLGLTLPSSTELAQDFGAARLWIEQLRAMRQIRIEWRTLNHRVQGAQQVPQSIWLDDLNHALALIGKGAEAAQFGELLELTQSRQPTLIAWMEKRPLQALELADKWAELLSVIDWIVQHPRAGIYLRQVDISGVHSKFIEAHRQVLAQWLDFVLPAAAIHSNLTGANQFCARYGFLDKPARVRFRVLDDAMGILPGIAYPDITLDADSFAALNSCVERAFITENETNFLAFPLVKKSIVIFGSGYGWDALANIAWLDRCKIFYWGDIDTHGFAILNQLRNRYAHVESFLMDKAILMAHEALWGTEGNQSLHDLTNLTMSENALFNELRDNRLGKNLRLEQEMIGFEMVRSAVEKLSDGVLPAPTNELTYESKCQPGPPEIKSALPPAAAVLIVSVRSEQKRNK